MNAKLFVDQISQYSLPAVFNPYRDACSVFDHEMSPRIRCANLANFLNVIEKTGIDSVWLGRDLGYRGGRRTGIALTDEIHLPILEYHFGINGLKKATVGPEMKERTASVVWKVLREIDAKVFLWNVFPFHPYESDNPMTNRRHSSKEFDQSKEILLALLNWLQPRTIIAVGVDADIALSSLGFNVTKVRHPSYGGHREFNLGIKGLYKTRRALDEQV